MEQMTQGTAVLCRWCNVSIGADIADEMCSDAPDMREHEPAALGSSSGTPELLVAAAREMLDASAGVMGAYHAWLNTGDAGAAERLDRFDAAWASLHRQVDDEATR